MGKIPEFEFCSANHVVIEGRRGDDILAKSVGYSFVLHGDRESHYFVELSDAEKFLQSAEENEYYDEVEELREVTRSMKKDAAYKNDLSLDCYQNRVKLIRQAVRWKKKIPTLMIKLSQMYKERTGEEFDYSHDIDFYYYDLPYEEKKLAKEIDELPSKISKNLREAKDPPRTMTDFDKAAFAVAYSRLFW